MLECNCILYQSGIPLSCLGFFKIENYCVFLGISVSLDWFSCTCSSRILYWDSSTNNRCLK